MPVWVLGAEDPEMEQIERLLALAGVEVAVARRRGERVYGSRAFRATGTEPSLPSGAEVILVECGGRTLEGSVRVVERLDHHNPGDPGFGRPPAEFMAASSLGQVIGCLARRGRLGAFAWPREDRGRVGASLGELVYERYWVPRASGPGAGEFWCIRHGDDRCPHGEYWVVTRQARGAKASTGLCLPQEVVLSAAADHCLSAAYAGRCPGVDPAALRAYRMRRRAAWLRSLPGSRNEVRRLRHIAAGERLDDLDSWVRAVEAVYRYTAAELERRPRLMLGGVEVIDVRGGILPELPEVLAQSGQVGLLRRRFRRGVRKIVLLGAGEGTPAGPAPVETFLAMARRGNVAGSRVLPETVYGDPARGFAGVEEAGEKK